MNNPFQSVGGGTSAAVSPASVGYLPQESNKEVNPKPAMKMEAQRVAATGAVSSTQVKKTWWKFWVSQKVDGTQKESPVLATKLEKTSVPDKVVENQTNLERKLTDKEKAENRHSELLSSVDSICRALEDTKGRPIEITQDVLPPMPVENLEALTRSTEKVSGVLDQMTGQLENAGKRDDLMIKSIANVDSTLGSLKRVNEKSVTALDGVKQVLGGVNVAMKDMQEELKDSSKRYKALCEEMHKAESEHSDTVAKLQMRTLIVGSAIGVGLIVSLIAVAIS
jgi:chromosome segregation ATPase